MNKIVFLHTKTEYIQYCSIHVLNTRKAEEIIQGLTVIKEKYESRGFKINIWHGDNEFKNDAIKKILFPGLVDLYAKNEHVGVM